MMKGIVKCLVCGLMMVTMGGCFCRCLNIIGAPKSIDQNEIRGAYSIKIEDVPYWLSKDDVGVKLRTIFGNHMVGDEDWAVSDATDPVNKLVINITAEKSKSMWGIVGAFSFLVLPTWGTIRDSYSIRVALQDGHQLDVATDLVIGETSCVSLLPWGWTPLMWSDIGHIGDSRWRDNANEKDWYTMKVAEAIASSIINKFSDNESK